MLLHFKYTTTQFYAYGNKASDEAENRLKKFFNTYDKGSPNLGAKSLDWLFEKIPTAIRNAKRAIKYSRETNSIDPSTRVYSLVEELQELKQKIEARKNRNG